VFGGGRNRRGARQCSGVICLYRTARRPPERLRDGAAPRAGWWRDGAGQSDIRDCLWIARSGTRWGRVPKEEDGWRGWRQWRWLAASHKAPFPLLLEGCTALRIGLATADELVIRMGALANADRWPGQFGRDRGLIEYVRRVKGRRRKMGCSNMATRAGGLASSRRRKAGLVICWRGGMAVARRKPHGLYAFRHNLFDERPFSSALGFAFRCLDR
jgi:hypothetical protein